MRSIPLTQGQVALVDDEDYEMLNQWKWCAHRQPHSFYALRHGPTVARKQSLIRMHNVVMNPPPGMWVDHLNHVGTDNRRANLRLATPRQNSRNQRPGARGGSSQYKGVIWNRQVRKWQAYIKTGEKHLYLGAFTVEEDAARAYDAAAIEHFGEFASLNADVERAS